ncbi:MAG TPA: 50S ribosomal protein L25 [Verrucomicrobiae bacterium]|nr:50S ribosomal protein L25 [Verrucomicrobiae bacterium]
MKSVALNAVARTQSRRAGAKLLRSSGRIPAVIYGGKSTPQNLELDAEEMDTLIHHSVSENLLVDLAVKDDAKPKRLALVQEVQHHPLSGKVLHVDFHEVSPTEKVTIMVPVETTGEAAGVKNSGGVLEHVLFKLKVRALPKDLPEQILIDVTALEMNKTIHIGEIPAQDGVEILGNKNTPVVSVAPPRAEEEVVATEAKTAGDVEMTKEKKEDGSPADAKAGDKAAPAKGDAKAAAGDKKAEAKPDAKAEKKK